MASVLSGPRKRFSITDTVTGYFPQHVSELQTQSALQCYGKLQKHVEFDSPKPAQLKQRRGIVNISIGTQKRWENKTSAFCLLLQILVLLILLRK